MIPYPLLRTDYWADVAFWWDLEFWNRSVTREGGTPRVFEGTPRGTFPKIALSFDRTTGRANVDFDSYVTQAVGDARFHIAGKLFSVQRDAAVVFPERPWRADWITTGLYSDGWTLPGRTARIRVFARPGRTTPELRTLSVSLSGADPVKTRQVHFTSNTGTAAADVGPTTVVQQLTVWRPARPAGRDPAHRQGLVPDLRIGGDSADGRDAAESRCVVRSIQLADAAGPTCRPA